MRGRGYSAAEDDAIRQHYPAMGASWEGWAELLPGRTTSGIASRARHIGVSYERPVMVLQPANDGGEPGAALTPDPEERHVLGLMAQGLAPSEIDERERWLPNTAKRILMHRWAREGP